MKTRLLMILLAFGVPFTMSMTDAFEWCSENKDWPDAPCYVPYQSTSESFEYKVKEDWASYYDYKGEFWMEQKRYEMEQAIQNNALDKWLDLAESHRNVHHYYYLQGDAPDLNGKYVFTCNLYEDVFRYEEILKDDPVLKKFLKHFPLSTSFPPSGIDESRPPQTSILYQYDDQDTHASLLMRVFEGEDKEPCIVPRTYTLTYHHGSINTEIRNSDVDTSDILEFLDSLYFHQSPSKQFKSGIPIEKIQCKELLTLVARHDGSPACVKPESVTTLIERSWVNGTQIENKWTASYYPSKRPLPNGEFDVNLENVVPWLIMQELEQGGVKNWKNDPSTGAHTDEGWSNPSKMCSSLVVDVKTRLYVSSTFYSEPELFVSEIVIDDLKPTDCQKWFSVPYGVDSETGNLLYDHDEEGLDSIEWNKSTESNIGSMDDDFPHVGEFIENEK
ncbi:MAG: hypothetical protein OEW49_04150 [Nitrosopumilus sp.]|nr:hypothetical protein [Nitrosopumilus sp.]